MTVDGAGRKDSRGIKRRYGGTWGGVFCGLTKMVKGEGGMGGEGRREGGVGRGGGAGRGGRVIDIEFHVVWIEATVVICGGKVLTHGLACGGEGGDGELLLWTAILVDNDDMDLLKVLYEGMEIVYLETAARVVATLDETGERGERGGSVDAPARPHGQRWRGR